MREAEEVGVQYLNFVFYGTGSDYLSVSVKAHQDLLSYLSVWQEQYWLDSYINIMTHLQCVKFTRVITQQTENVLTVCRHALLFHQTCLRA